MLYGTPTLCLLGGLLGIRDVSGSRTMFLAAICAGSAFSSWQLKKNLQNFYVKKSLNKLEHTVVSLEKTFIQFKKLLLLVHQNDFLSQNISL